MKKRIASVFLLAVVLFILLPIRARADMLPPFSNTFRFQDTGNRVFCYAVLSQTGFSTTRTDYEEYVKFVTTSPYSYKFDSPPEREVWQKFQDYWDPDGYRCASTINTCRGDCSRYYAPASDSLEKPFKILCYFPETRTLAVSQALYPSGVGDDFIISLRGNRVTVSCDTSGAHRAWDLLGLLLRIAATIALELAVAWAMGFRGAKHALLIAGANVVTQLLLNAGFYCFPLPAAIPRQVFIALYETLIFLGEGALYASLFPKFTTQPCRRSRCFLYSLAANCVSFAVGLVLSGLLPKFF